MFEMSFQSDIDKMLGSSGVFGRLTSDEINRITVIALNKAIDGGVTEADRAIRAEFQIKRDDLRKVMGRPAYATKYQMSARLLIKGHRIPVYYFNPRPSEPGNMRKPVTVSIKKGGGRKGKSTWFVARMKSGHIGVFERRGAAPYPIKEVFTISVPEMLRKRDITAQVHKNTRERFNKEFERLVKVMLKGGF